MSWFQSWWTQALNGFNRNSRQPQCKSQSKNGSSETAAAIHHRNADQKPRTTFSRCRLGQPQVSRQHVPPEGLELQESKFPPPWLVSLALELFQVGFASHVRHHPNCFATYSLAIPTCGCWSSKSQVWIGCWKLALTCLACMQATLGWRSCGAVAPHPPNCRPPCLANS